MEQREIAIGLDIGTTKIVAIVGHKNEYGKMEILGFGKAKSLGVQRGVVSNITQTIESIRYAVNEAEVDSGLSLSSCVVGIAGQHIRSLQHSDYILREDAQEVITQMILINLWKMFTNWSCCQVRKLFMYCLRNIK